ncbi:hypothetical protein CBL_09913 [Carabus blaptoides fortunei]
METETPTPNTETSSGAIEKVKCVKCQCMREPVLREGLGWMCRVCTMTKSYCRHSCGYQDIDGDSDFAIYFFSMAPSNELHKFDCTVEIKHPKGGTPYKRILNLQYDRIWDWRLRIPRNEFSAYANGNQFTMKVVLGRQRKDEYCL